MHITDDDRMSQVSSPTSWSLCSRSGTASPSPACSARLWWATCTRTRLAGAASDTPTNLQRRQLRSLEEMGREKTSLNAHLVSRGVSFSFIRGGEELVIKLRVCSPEYFLPQPVARELWEWERWKGVCPSCLRNGSLCWSSGAPQEKSNRGNSQWS